MKTMTRRSEYGTAAWPGADMKAYKPADDAKRYMAQSALFVTHLDRDGRRYRATDFTVAEAEAIIAWRATWPVQ